MFKECTSLINAPKLNFETFTGTAPCLQMFYGCTSLVNPPSILKPTTATVNAYYYMFVGCTSLIKSPEFMATIIQGGSFYGTFQGCSTLSSIHVHFTSWPTPGTVTTNWVDGVSASGTFICPSGLPEEYGVERIPENWTIEYI